MKIMRTWFAVALLFMFLPQAASAAYLFTAPPRESLEKGERVYKPISDFLTQVTGEKFEYSHPKTWAEYVKNMRSEKYDLVFDGPHFVDWRIHNLEHRTIVRLPSILRWQVITRKNDDSIKTIDDLAGKKACAPGSPNFGMLNLFSHFKDPNKQPQHVEVKGWINVYEAVKNRKCDAGVLPKTNRGIYDRDGEYTKVIHTHLPYPNQAITASKRISELLKEQIREALLSPEGQQALMNLRKRYTDGAKLVSAEDDEYDSVHFLLEKAKSFAASDDNKTVMNYDLVNN